MPEPKLCMTCDSPDPAWHKSPFAAEGCPDGFHGSLASKARSSRVCGICGSGDPAVKVEVWAGLDRWERECDGPFHNVKNVGE